MQNRTVHDQPSEVTAIDGAVDVDGPEDVRFSFTPEGAEETSDRLSEQAVRARGQRRLSGLIHRPKA